MLVTHQTKELSHSKSNKKIINSKIIQKNSMIE